MTTPDDALQYALGALRAIAASAHDTSAKQLAAIARAGVDLAERGLAGCAEMRGDGSPVDIDALTGSADDQGLFATPPKPAPDALRDALEPFAKAAETFDSWSDKMRQPDSANICTFIPESGKLEDGAIINYGHCRKARVALSPAPVPPDKASSLACAKCGMYYCTHSIDERFPAPLPPADGVIHRIEHDGFEGTIQGHYVTREGKRGVVLQQVGTKVVHVYGERWLAPLPAGAAENSASTAARDFSEVAPAQTIEPEPVGVEAVAVEPDDDSERSYIDNTKAESPPVRGEREAIARAILQSEGLDYDHEQEMATKFDSAICRSRINRVHCYADAILSLQSSPAALSDTSGASTADK